MRKGTPFRSGFTMIELLVVTSLISLLASMGVATINDARVKAKVAVAQQELQVVTRGILLMADDTGKWPNGCAVGDTQPYAGNEIILDHPCSGLITPPPLGPSACVPAPECEWTAQDLSKWDGPYVIPDLLDPWNYSYYFDADYLPYLNCGNPGATNEIVVVSLGVDRSSAYDCDDVFIKAI